MNLVIGLGEIGSAIQEVLQCPGHDKDERYDGKVTALHICFPYSDSFKEAVVSYQDIYKPKVTIIHSTVPVGTSDSLGAVHSPVRGVHPYLAPSIRTFVKIFGGDKAGKAARIFKRVGVKTKTVKSARDTEAGKLWSTTGYGLNIILEKAVKEFCDKNSLDFGVVYTLFNETYNKGYQDMNMPHFQKYNLRHYPGRVGGHCIEPNLDLLDSQLAEDIKKYIDTYQN